MSERRLVLVTGAGASRALGSGRPLPLMNEWALDLATALDRVRPGMASDAGLRDGLSAMDVESVVERILLRQSELPPRDTDKAIAAIAETLWSTFNRAIVDQGAARKAYGALLVELDGFDEDRFVCVTTNYDWVLEIAIELQLGRSVEDGFQPLFKGGKPIFQPRRLHGRVGEGPDWVLEGAVRVLHLHGAVGWYRTFSGDLTCHDPGDSYQSVRGLGGTPFIVAPGPNKRPTDVFGFSDLWEVFRQVLADATHILVLGHGLGDQHLKGELERADHAARVAVTRYRPAWKIEHRDFGADPEPGSEGTLDREFTSIACDFGPDLAIQTERLKEWWNGDPRQSGAVDGGEENADD